MLTVIKLSFFGTEVGLRLVYLLLSIGLLVAFTYIFGYHILVGGLKGGDAGHAFHNLYWYTRWFPKIPLWYPLQGGGFAFTLNYSLLGAVLSPAILSNLSQFDLAQSLKVVTFVSYIFAAVGIYLFGAWRMRNQTLGLIAALLFLALPGPWFWITKLGYYALAIAASFVPWAFVFFDWFLESFNEKHGIAKVVIKLLFAAIFLGFTFLTHGFAGMPTALGLFVYGVTVGLIGGKKLLSLRRLSLGFLAALLTSATTVLLFAFWFFPVGNYSRIASQGGNQNVPAELLIRWSEVQNPKRLLFDWGQQPISDQFPMPPFPRIVSYLAVLSLPFALALGLIKRGAFKLENVSKSSIKAVGLIAISSSILIGMGLAAWLSLDTVESLRSIFSYFNFYSLTIPYALVPLTAAFSVFAVVWVITEIPFLVFYLPRLRNKAIIRYMKGFLVAIISILVFINLLVFFERGASGKDFYGWGAPEDPISSEKKEYGYEGTYFRSSPEPFKIDENLISPKYYQKLIQKSFAYSVINEMRTDPPQVSSDSASLENYILPILSHMQLDQFTRVGLSGSIGVYLQQWNTFTDASTLNQFHYQGSLFQSMRGFQESVFFGKDERNHSSKLLDDLARYIGYKYVVTSNAEDTKHYSADSWELVGEEGAWQIYEFKDYQGMVSISQRPKVLVIGNKKGAYESVFRAGAEGVLPYEKGWLIEGGERIDKYSLSELQEFDGIIAYGYSYKSRNKAFSLLDKYVKQGGRVFIDTGWQFVSRDWQLENAPSFFPVTGLSWINNISPGKHALTDSQSNVLGISTITLEWEGQAWGVSEAVGLKDWAKPLLTVEGKTLMAGGNYGEGKIIWSGLNLFGYLFYQQYEEGLVDMSFLIFDELLMGTLKGDDVSLSASRAFPDEVEINISSLVPEGTALLWREPYSPDWKVVMENGKTKKLPTYRAGPGFLMTFLPETEGSSTLILKYELGLIGLLGKLVSVSSIIFFVSIILDQILNRGRFLSLVKNKVISPKLLKKLKIFKNPKQKLRKFWEEE